MPADEDESNKNALLQHPVLKDIKLDSVSLKPNSKGINKLIAEIELRSETGATIIGIERKGESIVNPKSDFELAEGDHVLLLGSEKQISAAKEFLNSGSENK